MACWNFCSDVNIPYAYRSLRHLMGWSGRTQKIETRNGMALVLDGPLAISVLEPRERVLFDVKRNANPVFHLMESLWMLAGRNDVAFPARFNKQMLAYVDSENPDLLNGAYGYRWRQHFGHDQLAIAVERLKKNHNDRQVVITMWDPYNDLTETSKDIPCNQQVMLRIVRGKLNMLTTNRSNDMVWGLMGANCVHLTVLQEYLAAAIGVPIGMWYHTSNNLHVYEQHWPLLTPKNTDLIHVRGDPLPGPYPGFSKLVQDPASFLEDCSDLCTGQDDDFKEPFFDQTVAPMVQSWEEYRAGDLDKAIYDASCIGANDWRIATVAWYRRKKDATAQQG